MALNCEQKLDFIFKVLCNPDGSSKIATLQTDITNILDNQEKILFNQTKSLDNQVKILNILNPNDINQIDILKKNTKFLVNQDGTSNLKFTDILDLLRDSNSSSSYIKQILDNHNSLIVDGEHLLFTIFQKIGVHLPFTPSTLFEAIAGIEVNPTVNINTSSINSKLDSLIADSSKYKSLLGV